MTDLQALFDAMKGVGQSSRARYGMTLGRLIEALEALPGTHRVVGVGEPDSYRGYYEDLAFSPHGETTVADWLRECRGCVGRVFEGYKGGKYRMGTDTPVWIARYGTTAGSGRIMSLEVDGETVAPVVVEEQW